MRHLCTVLLMCCAMSVLCFSLQPLYAQEKKRVNRKEVEERASGGDFYRVIIENNLFVRWVGKDPTEIRNMHWSPHGLAHEEQLQKPS